MTKIFSGEKFPRQKLSPTKFSPIRYADKVFITLSASFGTLSIASHATVVGIPFGIAGALLTLIFTVTTSVVKKLSSVTKEKKKKHNKIIVLARNKLNIVETLLSSALSDFDIIHEEFVKIIDEKVKYDEIKENIKNVKHENLDKENNQTTSL